MRENVVRNIWAKGQPVVNGWLGVPNSFSAEVMANAMAGDTEVLEAYENIKPWRIPFGQWFGNQVVALGMLYFRALDLSPL